MRPFQQYVSELTALVGDVTGGTSRDLPVPAIVEALNGGPSRALNRLVSREELRDSGVFFTGHEMATRVVERISDTVKNDSVLVDPACGTGDLLIACSRTLETQNSLGATVSAWAGQLIGRDIFSEFVVASKLRLTLSAVQMLTERNVHDYSGFSGTADIFPHLQQHCSLTDNTPIRAATHIVMNPPFALVEAPPECSWVSGKVNAAALFVDECLKHAKPGVHLVTILPDVLRSGSRYKEWRRRVESRATVREIATLGQFDARVDVDVFLLHLEVGASDVGGAWSHTDTVAGGTVGDKFHVRVGSVVDYRDPHDGEYRPFIRSRGLVRWGTVRDLQERRQFAGCVFSPPFVVVRRTSRHGDKHRAVATIIDSPVPVAVENHLLVLSPRDGSMETCERLVSLLNQSSTNVWLDRRIRCRHLTVSALGEIPWEPDSHV